MFERDHDDLLVAAPLSFTQMAMGSEVKIPALDSEAVVQVPAGTQHGTIFRVAGRGLPDLRSGRRGDLVVIAQLVVPRKLNDTQRELLQEYAKTEDLHVGMTRPTFWEKVKDAVIGS